jgi:hypothetical protein
MICCQAQSSFRSLFRTVRQLTTAVSVLIPPAPLTQCPQSTILKAIHFVSLTDSRSCLDLCIYSNSWKQDSISTASFSMLGKIWCQSANQGDPFPNFGMFHAYCALLWNLLHLLI